MLDSGSEVDRDDPRVVAWHIEITEDPEVRDWFLSVLPPEVRAEKEIYSDIDDRPFPLEPDEGPYRCSNCGVTGMGAHIRIIDRGQRLEREVSADDLRYCSTCVANTLGAGRG